MRSHILRKSAYRIFFRIYKLRFQNRICGNYAAYAKIRISSHISAYAMPHIWHICRIFQRIISPNSVYFLAYFASKRPAYFKKNFRFMVMCLVFFLLQEPRVTTRYTPNMAAHKKVCLKFEPSCKSSIQTQRLTEDHIQYHFGRG